MITFAKEVIKGIKKINKTEMGVLPGTLLLSIFITLGESASCTTINESI